MKKLFSFCLLLIHFNAAMFFPWANEHDVYDSNGRQVDEINSVAEFVFHHVLDIIPANPLDEDSDEQKFLNIHNSNYTLIGFFNFSLIPFDERSIEKTDLYNYHLPFIVEELFIPPPEIG